jgi:hypothetical protein
MRLLDIKSCAQLGYTLHWNIDQLGVKVGWWVCFGLIDDAGQPFFFTFFFERLAEQANKIEPTLRHSLLFTVSAKGGQ